MTSQHFDEREVLQKLKQYLPSQTPLKDFIHHNPLHAFQDMKFFDAIFRASQIFGYQVTLQLNEFRHLHEECRIREEVLQRVIIERKGAAFRDLWRARMVTSDYDEHVEPRVGQLRANWKSNYNIDIDNLVHPVLFRVVCSYLDQGIAISHFPLHELGFLASLRELEKNSFTSFFKTSRAKKLLQVPGMQIRDLLQLLVGDEKYFEQYLFDQQFSHHGWSGMVATIESQPHSLLDRREISLRDFIYFELLLEIDALDDKLGANWQPISRNLKAPPIGIFDNTDRSELEEVLSLWQEAFEWSYYDEALAGLQINAQAATNGNDNTPIESESPCFQSIFCIDERECSLRRHLETIEPSCETLGCPGFFGVEFYFQPDGARFHDKLCPAPVNPKFLVKEHGPSNKPASELLYSKKTHRLLPGFATSLTLGFVAGFRTGMNLFRPKMSPAISNAFAHMHPAGKLTVEHTGEVNEPNGLQVGFTVTDMATRVESVLRSIGLTKRFAPLVYVVAHGSSSANNPHHGAHDCGACSGRPGSVNARVFAHMANHPRVRAILKNNGIEIPNDTTFVGALHDTAADQVQFYDTHVLNASNTAAHNQHTLSFEKALELNAKERSRRFASVNTKANATSVRKSILKRSVSLFEPRPELGHGTNALCIVGRRSITKGLFLDRRAFLNSYDYRTDPGGTLLTNVLRPLAPVCGGINLEYYFSRVDNHKLGSGTKLPHNVMGLVGVSNSSDGDLRPGLPLQMIEVHDPVRLMIIVEHNPEVVLSSIQSDPALYAWFMNEWVMLAVLNPADHQLHYFKSGNFVSYSPLANYFTTVTDFHELFETAAGMQTNHIVHATRENLPVYLYN